MILITSYNKEKIILIKHTNIFNCKLSFTFSPISLKILNKNISTQLFQF